MYLISRGVVSLVDGIGVRVRRSGFTRCQGMYTRCRRSGGRFDGINWVIWWWKGLHLDVVED